ncbi:proline iminopeptidase-family hydrolase [Pullulanibacillus camelliae]|nr:proline iminopeptidase-family hydrolase [Pullulanibacillus camelliae]
MEEGYISVTGGNIYYKKVGVGPKLPLILLHGGPGGTHRSMKALEALGDERTVIFYDQLGSGRSDHPTDPSLWHIERFVDELAQIREALDLQQLHILGHSWGTMLAASYLLTQPQGVHSIIFSGPCLSAPQWAKDQEEHRKALPVDVQKTLEKCEKLGMTDSEEYKAAVKVFNKHFVNRFGKKPKEPRPKEAQSNEEVYHTMWGPSEFYTTGNLKSFDVTDRLSEIRIPALFTCGRYDEATPATTESYSKKLPGSQLHVFEKSAHVPYIEEPEEYRRVIRQFLHDVEMNERRVKGL